MKRKENGTTQVHCYCVGYPIAFNEHIGFKGTRLAEGIKGSIFNLKRILEKNVSWERTVGWIISCGTLAILTVIAVGFIGSHVSRIETGTVEYKYITGVKDGRVHVLLVNAEDKVIMIEDKFEKDIRFHGKSLVIDATTENEIMQGYNDLEYRFSMRSSKTDRSAIYILPRDVFNTLQIGSTVKVEIEKPRGGRIRKLINKDKNIIANHSYHREMQGISHFLCQ